MSLILQRHRERLLYPPRDPVTIGISLAAAFTSATGVILPATIFGISTFSAIGTIAVGALLTGAQFALSKLSGARPGGGILGQGINAPEVRGNVQQSAPAQRVIYGRTRVGGAVFFLDTESPPYLYIGLLLAARKINRVVGLHIGANDLQVPPLIINTVTDPVAVDGQVYIKSGASRLKFCLRDGSDSQPIDALLAAGFPSLDSQFRQRGIATATFRFEYGDDRDDFEKMWGQVSIPNPLLDVEGALIFDPRDPGQDRDNPSSWKYSNNAALVQADWLRQPYGVNYPAERIDWEKVGYAADFDDEPVGNADGTYSKRHTIDGIVTLDQQPRQVMEAMLTANRGFLAQQKGRGWIESSRPKDPSLTIDDALLLGGFEFRDDKAKTDTVNTVRTRFSSSDREYQDIDGPVLVDADALAADGEELAITVKLPFTSDYRAAERLAQQYKDEARLPRALTCTVKLRALGLKVGDCVRVYSTLYTRMNGLYLIQQVGFLDDFSGLQLSLAEYDPTIALNWVAATDEKPFTLPALNLS